MSLHHICVTSSPYLATLELLKIDPDSVLHLTPLLKLLVPRSRKRAGDHSFVVAAPRLWNELPIQLREAGSVSVFKRLLKHICTNVRCFVVLLSCFIFASYFVRRCALWRAPYMCRLIIK